LSHIPYLKLPHEVGNLMLIDLGPQVGTTADAVIDYIDQGDWIALWVQITNLDGTNPLEFAVNNPEPRRTIPAGAVQTLSNTPIEQLYIYPNAATGDWEVQNQVVKLLTLMGKAT